MQAWAERLDERAPKFRDTHISLAHGNGGRLMRELIEELFVPALANPQLDTGADAVALPIPADRDLVVTTDGFTVQPLEFPGGNIGSLAVHGTVNDLAVSGAVPRFMTLNVFLEEGLEIALLRRVIDALAHCGARLPAWRWSPAIPRSSAAATATGSIWRRPAWASGRAARTSRSIGSAPAIVSWSAVRSATMAPPSCSPARNSVCAGTFNRTQPACCRRRRR